MFVFSFVFCLVFELGVGRVWKWCREGAQQWISQFIETYICWNWLCSLQQCDLYLHVFVLVFAELKLAQSLQCSEQLFWHDTPPKFVLWCQIKSDSAARTYVCVLLSGFQQSTMHFRMRISIANVSTMWHFHQGGHVTSWNYWYRPSFGLTYCA